ncbi:MAG: ABC transporter permease subunit [Ruminococcaceae bacterium]|nr:ABC transporter permease subunit [Oscillospiraceae bacterium]
MKEKNNLRAVGKGSLASSIAANKYMYLLLTPAVICVFIFGYAPLCGLLLAFKDYDALLGFAKSPWVGLINNYWVYILPYGFTFYTFVILRSFIQEIPEALEESALLDGANEITVMFKIIIPLSLPALATVALWVAVGQWNDWTTTLYYITDSDLFPLQYVIMRIIKQGEQIKQEALLSAMGASQSQAVTTSESVKASMLIVTSVPIIMVYPFLQKYFVKGVTLGAVKG